jgi:hypothetical protein
VVTKVEAAAIVQKRLDSMTVPDDSVVVAEVDEYPWGWVVYYQSKRFMETGDYRAQLAGNAPFFVTRDDGVLHEPVAGSGVPIFEHVRLFEATLAKR